MNFKRLFYVGKTGSVHQWDIWTVGSIIMTRHGQVNGKLQESSKQATAKNVGRSNATTSVQQAELEASAMHTHKLKRKYSLTPEEASQTLFLPMLAHNFKKNYHGINYPVMVQRKYDGFRCLAEKENGVVTLYSREGEVFNLNHISNELATYIPEGYVVDGELYRHKTKFQRIASWIKKSHPESKTLKFIMYDVPESDVSDRDAAERNLILQTMNTRKWISIEIAETFSANTKEEVLEYEEKFVADDYEGAIVRIPKAKYQYGYRSYSLLKVKSFDDEEFEVIGGHCGVGKMSNQCIFECRTKEGETFNVVPMGSAPERCAYLTNVSKYIGKMLTVKFKGKSILGKPLQPIGKAFREKFDK